MSLRYIFIIIGIILSINSSGQLRDTSLFTIYSRPFYYNVVKDWSGNIYAGSSDGTYLFKETNPVKINSQNGYLKIDSKGKVSIDSNGVKYHQQNSMIHMLPFPTEKRDEYHVGNEHYFYITSGGRMHVYEILPYAYRFRNHSIRTISSNFTGTYSGIYYQNRLLGHPISPFTDGYIREYNGKVFMCTNGLDVYNIEDIKAGKKVAIQSLPTNFNFIPTRDIRYVEKIKKYIVVTGNRLALLDSNLQSVVEIFKAPTTEDIVILNINSKYNLLYFSNSNKVYVFDLSNNKVIDNSSIKETIVDGVIQLRTQYLLTSNGLYMQQGEGNFDKIISLKKAHTMLSIAEEEFVISTDEGLFLYRQNENKLHPLIPGVEFNRNALFTDKNKLYAGSINGLYIIDLAQIDIIITRSAKMLSSEYISKIPVWFILIIVTVILLLLILLLKYKRRLKKIQSELVSTNKDEVKPKLSRADIESFIKDFLPTASLKSIVDHFDTNNSMVYNILAPNKPGDLIQQLRYEKVKELRSEGKSAKQISEVTGLSDSYVRKIWNNPS